MIKSNFLKVIATALAMLLGTGVFFELGLWQLHRAQSTSRQGKVVPSSVPVALTSIDRAGKNIYTAAINRVVTFQGHYVKNYVAPTQSVPGIGYRDLEVGLFLISDNRAILVVRGLNDGSFTKNEKELAIQGRLYPRQQEDHGWNFHSWTSDSRPGHYPVNLRFLLAAHLLCRHLVVYGSTGFGGPIYLKAERKTS
jgi:cytochrome oxidase assembly protein ShyY1